jgi:hypothetical protein
MLVELHDEQIDRRFRAAIGLDRIVAALLVIRIVEIHIAELMPHRGYAHHPAACGNEIGQSVDQQEMTEVIGAELRLETICRAAQGRSHDPRIGDDQIEPLAACTQRGGGGSDARQIRQVQLRQREARPVGICNRCGGSARLFQVTRSACHLCAVCCERACRLHAQSRRYTGDQNTFSAEVNAVQYLIAR